MKKIILITLLIILSSCRNSITLVENISDTSDLEYALEIDEANPQNMEEALKRYAADHNGQYKLIFTGTSTKKYDIWTSISQMLEKISLKNIKTEISLDNVIFPNNKIPDNLFGANAINKSIVKITFPDTITEIGEYSFYCPELTEITLPSNLITIGNRGLIGCYNLKSLKLASIEIPDSVTSIGKTAFGDCENLIDIKLPNNLEIISEGMFESCGSLNTITIPASVKTIEKFAFYYSKNFESIKFLNDNPGINNCGRKCICWMPFTNSIYTCKQ